MRTAMPEPVARIANGHRRWWRSLTGPFRNAQPEEIYRRMGQLLDIPDLEGDAVDETCKRFVFCHICYGDGYRAMTLAELKGPASWREQMAKERLAGHERWGKQMDQIQGILPWGWREYMNMSEMPPEFWSNAWDGHPPCAAFLWVSQSCQSSSS